MKTIFDTISDYKAWEDFDRHLSLKERENSPVLQELRAYVDEARYLAAAERLKNGAEFPDPEKKLISKGNSAKKRTVYTFPAEEGILLKFIARQMKRYDRLFAPNLYSFRCFKTAKDAWSHIVRIRNLGQKYVYKVDISDYFRSVDPALLLPDLKRALEDDPDLYRMVESLLLNPFVTVDGKRAEEKKGVLPGVPISAFLANFYLKEMDWHFFRSRIEYLRYSDDIIVFADSAEEARQYAEQIKSVLGKKHLAVNTEKEVFTRPDEPWEFLGFTYHRGVIDVSPVAFSKLKAKMRRKTRALKRWADRKDLNGICAAKAFVKRFNARLFENPVAGELTWARWYFPVITTEKTLKAIDAYAQDCIRYLATGRHTKARFNLRYDDLKAMGYRSLVHAYFKFKKGEFPLPPTEKD